MNYPAHLQIGFESKKQPSEDLAVSQAFVRLTELTVLSSRHFGPPSPAPADYSDVLVLSILSPPRPEGRGCDLHLLPAAAALGLQSGSFQGMDKEKIKKEE
ncbi:hypothetical protein VTI28DRAFT_10228 [Corynascus sepedonium]